MRKRVVITGLGPISPIGKERETFWHFLHKGISGIKDLRQTTNLKLKLKTYIGGSIPDFDPASYLTEKERERFSRFTQMAVVAADLALADAHLTVTPENAARIGVMLGTGIGGHEVVERQQNILTEKLQASKTEKTLEEIQEFVAKLVKKHEKIPLAIELAPGFQSKTLGDFLAHHLYNYLQPRLLEQQLSGLAEKDLIKGLNSCASATFSHAAAAEISIHCGLTGINYSLSTGCSAAANAIGAALDAIRGGKADVILTGGAEMPFSDVVYACFDLTRPKQLSARNELLGKAIAPYDKNRDGFLLAEGAGIVVLEELEHALKRGAYIYGELVGFGSSADVAYMDDTGAGMARAMEAAIKDADITPYELDYVCAHGSGSRNADLKETRALKLVLGEQARAVPVSTIKSVMGMPFGASSAFQLIAAALMLDKQTVIPTMHLANPDPECDLDYVPDKAREMILNYVLLDSMGLGGNNAVLVVKKYK